MGLKEDISEVKEEVDIIKNQSFAMELVKDASKKSNMFYKMWLITFTCLILCVIYIIYSLI